MPIPSEITALIERLNQELNQIEQAATEGLNLVRVRLEPFPDNTDLIQLFAFFNNAVFFVEFERRQIVNRVEYISESDVTIEAEIQDLAEDLATELGRVIENKIAIITVKNRLENSP